MMGESDTRTLRSYIKPVTSYSSAVTETAVNYTSHDASAGLNVPCFKCLTQVLATRILAVKASLCKLSTATAARACDFHAKLLLIAISSTLKSLLRPHVLNTPDKSPGDRLTEICSKNTDTGETHEGQERGHEVMTCD